MEPDDATTPSVLASIVTAASDADPPSSRIVYLVRNSRGAPVWVVDDGWLIWRQNEREIELSFARGRMRPGSAVFGYFAPQVAELPPGTVLKRTVVLAWPLNLDRLWNPESVATPDPGKHRISVRVGYGLTPRPDDPELHEGVEASVLRWQLESVSDPVELNIPRYHRREDTNR